jgi:hypothetical protein
MELPSLKFYDRAGKLISIDDYVRLHGIIEYRRVARSKVMDAADPTEHYDVSTVWLGLDHGFFTDRPVIFETMVFAAVEGANGFIDRACERYCTEKDATEGHRHMVLTVQLTMTDPIVMNTTEVSESEWSDSAEGTSRGDD